MSYSNPSTFDIWITDRIDFDILPSKTGNTGDFENWITDRIYYATFSSASEGRKRIRSGWPFWSY